MKFKQFKNPTFTVGKWYKICDINKSHKSYVTTLCETDVFLYSNEIIRGHQNPGTFKLSTNTKRTVNLSIKTRYLLRECDEPKQIL